MAGQLGRCILVLQYAFNLFSHNSAVGPNGYNEEEMKLVKETAKIWSTDDVAITATCIRVPVMRAHAESINLELNTELSEEDAKALLSAAPGVFVIDDRDANDFPTPLRVSISHLPPARRFSATPQRATQPVKRNQ
jgi:aspartate-semialdehyde dehydrogenase